MIGFSKNVIKNKRGILCAAALVLFSVCIFLISEYMQLGSIAETFEFVSQKGGVLLFCTFVIFLLTLSLSSLFGSATWGAAVCGVFIYVLSGVEYYKYAVSGSHIVIADLGFVANAGDISGFAEIRPEIHIFKAFAAVVLTVFFVALFEVRLKQKLIKRIVCALLLFGVLVAVISPLVMGNGLYEALGFETEPALTTMKMNERFESNGFLGFLSQDITENLDTAIEEPQGYSEELMEGFAKSSNPENGKRPNVVVIASESFADLREISEGDAIKGAYESLDLAENIARMGYCMLPTFGGYTTRSEFELLFGLPALSVSSVPSPHELLDERKDQDTVVREFLDLGYNTTYIHCFDGTFYNRSEMYPKYGFSKLLFAEDFDTGRDSYKRYISDEAVLAKVREELLESEAPSFVFAMTMQNHQPYIEEGSDVLDELNYYLDGVRLSADALLDFLLWARSFDEETVVLFVGDHYPFFTPQGGVYEALGISDSDAEKLYTQKYFAYSNYKELNLPKEKVSLFYLPHVIKKEAGIKTTAFNETMLECMKEKPVYGIATYDGVRSEKLDAITYDRTLGKGYLK